MSNTRKQKFKKCVQTVLKCVENVFFVYQRHQFKAWESVSEISYLKRLNKSFINKSFVFANNVFFPKKKVKQFSFIHVLRNKVCSYGSIVNCR